MSPRNHLSPSSRSRSTTHRSHKPVRRFRRWHRAPAERPWGAADDAEHLGRRRLMLQGLAQFGIALLDFLEQPHVLDGDHRLIGEGLEKGDLLFSERTNFRAANMDHANRNTFAE